jgi:Undecaprenyl-phosphate galactose phosphotransferase WbaP
MEELPIEGALERALLHRARQDEIKPEWVGRITTQTHAGIESSNGVEALEIDLASIENPRGIRKLDPAFKRLVDIVLSMTALVVLSPVLLLIWIAIKASSRGPAIYRHRRIGRDGVFFDCLKFRTMVQNADELLEDVLSGDAELRAEHANNHKLRADPRVTRIGKVLRKTSLDEFPQFWNVLRGDMSIVGPRPIVTEEVEKYGHWLPVILQLRPGITGLWQISGRNDTTYDERIALDRRYALSRNLVSDFSIMLKTPTVMIKRDGAY